LKSRFILRKKDLFLFDLDGVFYKGKENREKMVAQRPSKPFASLGRNSSF